VATVIRTDTGAALPIPTSDDTSNKGAILGENTAASEVDVSFGQLVLDAYKYSSKYVLVSVEFLQDSSINVAEFIGKALGERIGRIQNDHFTTGTGSSQPNGIVTAATLGRHGHGADRDDDLRLPDGPGPLRGPGLPHERQVHVPRWRP
jgi:HK97 family phage major capsid protein